MSHAFDTRTYTASSPELASSFTSLEDYETFARQAAGIAREKSDAIHHVWGSTRSGWALYTTKALLQLSPEITSLQFLTDGGHTITFETEYGLTAVSVLSPAGVGTAAAELDRLLSTLKTEPSRVYDADIEGMFSEGDVESALARDYVSAKPALDNQVRGDEGQGADYLFTYLRSVLALLRVAQAQRLSVVHALKV